jgi:uncharacterized protein (TIGR02246 family)
MHSDEQAIRAVIATWIAATRAGDAEQVLKLMADDVVFLTAGSEPMSKKYFAAGMARIVQADVDMEMESDIQEIRLMGEWAYCWNKLSVVMTQRHGGASIRHSGNVLSILQKQNGVWVVVRDANMLTIEN